ncbi:hypothetical protein Q4F19_11680 [Sphingomonas sp. BIUV-7]|uniref:Uncharacterized protein n=1 Tax=Sphingomonas natans TaxID=3063330 RepID=A0ABT8Y9N4_9SPHN|nr:hypothetical protein [Sphingomonas sp. BIUV-7]MDO6415042.1 hypothetical protein [Sphingomonas sp. BIUV-7]
MQVMMALALVAAAPGAPLSQTEKRVLAQAIACPERLADDRARIRNVEEYFSRYGQFRPNSHAGERMAYRDAVLRTKNCAPRDAALIHTFPEN